MTPRQSKRGAYRRRDCVFIGVWVPKGWTDAIDKAVETLDLDRSKLLRRALASSIKVATPTESN